MIKQIARLLILVLVATCAATAAYAEDVPPQPHYFYGAATLYGHPAPVGAQVEARGEGVVTGVADNPLVVTVAGQYGGPGLGGKLTVQGAVQDGTPIEFYVNGVKAQVVVPGGLCSSSYPFASGAITQLDLRVGHCYFAYLPLLTR